MIRVQATTYYNLMETLAYAGHWGIDFPPSAMPSFLPDAQGMYDLFTNSFDSSTYSSFPFLKLSGGSYVFTEDAEKVMNLLTLRYADHYPVWVSKDCPPFQPEEPVTEAEFVEAIQKFARFLFGKLYATYDRYSTMLGVYATQKAKLLDKVKSDSKVETRFNDTPQMGGDYTSDPYLSDYTKVTGENGDDRETPVERLAEIERKYNDILDKWVHEFASLFILKENVL